MEKQKNTRIMEMECRGVIIFHRLINVEKHNTCARRIETPLRKDLKLYLRCKNGELM